MAELKTEEKQNVIKKEPDGGITKESRILLFFLGLLFIGFLGYFALQNLWVRYIFAHIGGLGIIGLFGCWAGSVAKKKGYSYWKAFLFGFVFPVILGVFSVFLVRTLGGRGCGGIISIVAAILVVICYYFAKQKDVVKQIES
jgi:hypothetical protein